MIRKVSVLGHIYGKQVEPPISVLGFSWDVRAQEDSGGDGRPLPLHVKAIQPLLLYFNQHLLQTWPMHKQ